MFKRGTKLDTSQVGDRRGASGFGPVAGIGGGAAIIIVLVGLLLGADLTPLTQSSSSSDVPEGSLSENCRTGEDANGRQDCAIVGFVNSIQAYWAQAFAQAGRQYPIARTQLFSNSTQSGCGLASAQSGPFYCPVDQQIFLDLTFFNELQSRFGVSGGPLRRRTFWRMNTAITSRTSSASSIRSAMTVRGPRAGQSAPRFRPTA
jgi:uncharacterized protein